MSGKQIYWTKEKEKKWESICKGVDLNFTEWVEKKMEEELTREANPDYIQKKISEIVSEIERLNGEKNYWVKQRDLHYERKAVEQQKEYGEKYEKDSKNIDDRAYRTSSLITQYFGVKSDEAIKIAKIWLESQHKEPQKDPILLLIELSQAQNLNFVKDFPFLKRYLPIQ